MTLCNHLALVDIYNPQSAPALSPLVTHPSQPLRPLPPSQAWRVLPPPPVTGEQADESEQQAQPVKIEDVGETRHPRANKQEPLLSLPFPLCPALSFYPCPPLPLRPVS